MQNTAIMTSENARFAMNKFVTFWKQILLRLESGFKKFNTETVILL